MKTFMAMFSFTGTLVQFGLFLVRSDLDFMTSHRVTFLYPKSWTVKLFLPSDNANKTELSHNRVQI